MSETFCVNSARLHPIPTIARISHHKNSKKHIIEKLYKRENKMKKLIATVDYPFKLLKDGKINGKALERAEAEFNQSMLQDATETKKLLSFVIRKIFETFFEKQTAPNSEVVEIGSGLRLLSEILNNTLSNHNLTLHETYGSRHMVKTLRENGQKEKVKASQICPVQSIAQRFENI